MGSRASKLVGSRSCVARYSARARSKYAAARSACHCALRVLLTYRRRAAAGHGQVPPGPRGGSSRPGSSARAGLALERLHEVTLPGYGKLGGRLVASKHRVTGQEVEGLSVVPREPRECRGPGEAMGHGPPILHQSVARRSWPSNTANPEPRRLHAAAHVVRAACRWTAGSDARAVLTRRSSRGAAPQGRVKPLGLLAVEYAIRYDASPARRIDRRCPSG